LRLLVAEDDVRTAEYLVQGLRESGHIVDRAANGETALTRASTRRSSSIAGCLGSMASPWFGAYVSAIGERRF
jgi:CheY-like chemotaxis protein